MQLHKLADKGIDCFTYDCYVNEDSDWPRLRGLLCRLQPGDTLTVTDGSVLDENRSLAFAFVKMLVNERKVNVNILSLGMVDSTPIGMLNLDTMRLEAGL